MKQYRRFLAGLLSSLMLVSSIGWPVSAEEIIPEDHIDIETVAVNEASAEEDTGAGELLEAVTEEVAEELPAEEQEILITDDEIFSDEAVPLLIDGVGEIETELQTEAETNVFSEQETEALISELTEESFTEPLLGGQLPEPEIIEETAYELNPQYEELIDTNALLDELDMQAEADGEGLMTVLPDSASKTEEIKETQQEIEAIEDAAAQNAAAQNAAAADAVPDVSDGALYEDEITGEDSVSDVTSFLQAGASTGYLTSVSQVADVMRSRMRSRVNTFSFYYKGGAISSTLKNALIKAVAHTGNPIEGDYLFWQWGGYRYTAKYTNYAQNKMLISMTFNYYTSAAQETQVNSAVSTALRSALSGTGTNSTDYQKIEAIYRYITRNIRYDYTNLNNENYKLQYTAYGAIVNRTCVCQGYAVLLYRMMLSSGYDCRVVTSLEHAWNIVKLDGRYYNVDSTWDEDPDAGPENYSWFLQNMDDFYDYDHIRESDPGNGLNFASSSFSSAYPMSPVSYSLKTCDNIAGGHAYSWTKTDDATVFRGAMWRGVCTRCGFVGYRITGSKAAAYVKLNVSGTLPMKKKQTVKNIAVTGLGRGDSIASWKSSNTGIVTVSSKGVLKAKKKNGTATVTVTSASGAKASFKVRVKAPKVKTTRITGLPGSLKLKAGQKWSLKPVLQPLSSQDKVTYSSSSSKIVSVTKKGIIKAKKKGSAVITVKAGKKKFRIKVTVV